jgi:Zn-finger in Ran binding protein and others
MPPGGGQAPVTRPATMSGSVPFRAGDWKCGADGCGYHNFAKNVSCLRCGASRAQAALIADSAGGLSTPGAMSSAGSMYSPGTHHTSDSLSSIFGSSQFQQSQSYPAPLPPSGGQSFSSYSGPQGPNSMGGMGMSGSGRGGMQIDSGDWTCTSCGYLNFRRRNNCLRCNSLNPSLNPNPIGVGVGNPPGMMGPPIMRGQQQQLLQQSSQQPQLSMLDTSIVDSFLTDEPERYRVPQSAGPGPSSSLLRSMNNLSLGPLTSPYSSQFGTIGTGPMTAPPVISDDEYEFGSKSASAVERLGFFSTRSGQDNKEV